MINLRTDIKGIEETIQKIKKLNNKMTIQTVNKILRDSANPMVRAARRLAPVADHAVKRYSGGKVAASVMPGTLRKGVKYFTYKRSIGGILLVKSKSSSQLQKSRDDDPWYSHLVIRKHRTVKGKRRSEKLSRSKGYNRDSGAPMTSKVTPFFDMAQIQTQSIVVNRFRNSVLKIIEREERAGRI